LVVVEDMEGFLEMIFEGNFPGDLDGFLRSVIVGGKSGDSDDGKIEGSLIGA
jgi:hypothetical protein